ncbi:MAG: hypothetical protein Q7W05_14320, partial [Deltaproteobacteria bacterium]|nr:hypothetical protein [Deltaproteobacteria bacterium]
DLFEKHAKSKINGIDLGDIDWFHRLRNTLYHDGNGITVEPEKVDSYLQIARVLFDSLFDTTSAIGSLEPTSTLAEETFESPRTLLGKYTLQWTLLEIDLRYLALQYIPNHLQFSFLDRCAALEAKGIISKNMYNKVKSLYAQHSDVIRGEKIPSSTKIKEMVDTINLLLEELKK